MADRTAFTRAQVDALRGCCHHRYPTGLRNDAMYVTMWRTGVRVFELLALRVDDVDFSSQRLTVQRGKATKRHPHGRRRTIAIDARTLELVDKWIQRRADHDDNAPLFCTLAGQPISDGYVRAVMLRHRDRLRWTTPCSPHCWRHTCAIDMALDGIPLPLISQQLGHDSPQTTFIYLSQLGAAHSLASIAMRAW